MPPDATALPLPPPTPPPTWPSGELQAGRPRPPFRGGLATFRTGGRGQGKGGGDSRLVGQTGERETHTEGERERSAAEHPHTAADGLTISRDQSTARKRFLGPVRPSVHRWFGREILRRVGTATAAVAAGEEDETKLSSAQNMHAMYWVVPS